MKKHYFHFPFEGHLSSYVKFQDLKTYAIIDRFNIKTGSLFRDHIQIEAKLEIIYGV